MTPKFALGARQTAMLARAAMALALVSAIVVVALPRAGTSAPESAASPEVAAAPKPARPATIFPHEKHAGLFPSCVPCHEGAATGNEATLVSATADLCARCHDGARLPAVDWRPPERYAPNLVFDHATHVGEREIECRFCHEPGAVARNAATAVSDFGPLGDPRRADRMSAKSRPGPEACLPCHGLAEHFAANADCATCHRPVTEAPALTALQVAAFPVPDNHASPTWPSEHGALAEADLARCATCHTRETCETCHFNAESIGPIQQLGRDPRGALLAADIAAHWPRPADHDDAGWDIEHGIQAAASIENCANCHAQSSCVGCHGPVAQAPAAVAQLPEPPPGAAQGVLASHTAPPGHGPGFATSHGAVASSGLADCASCHSRDYCAQCHGASVAPGFHDANYLMRHAADAYARDTDCAGCHTTEVFCRTCHESVGLSGSPASASYHDAQPFWLLSHGTAARQNLENCASCHEQNDCLRCHSAKGGWSISPHGDGFDAGRLSDRSLLMCSRCHFSNPAP
jgi:predicted CXXCH cytochrome family protein